MSDKHCVKDSGQRRGFDTGSVRDVREGKGRFDLLPCNAIRLIARHFEAGSRKYGARNWERGQPLSVYLDSALRHTFAHLDGARDERHDLAAAWNLLCLIETQHRISVGRLPAGLNDLPPPLEDAPCSTPTNGQVPDGSPVETPVLNMLDCSPTAWGSANPLSPWPLPTLLTRRMSPLSAQQSCAPSGVRHFIVSQIGRGRSYLQALGEWTRRTKESWSRRMSERSAMMWRSALPREAESLSSTKLTTSKSLTADEPTDFCSRQWPHERNLSSV
jgi:hypothetical protein